MSTGRTYSSVLREEQAKETKRRIRAAAAELFAAWIRNMCEVGEPIIRAVLATRSEPDVAHVADRGDEAGRKGTRGLATRWESIGALREGLSVEEAAERLWLMTGVEQYLQAVDRIGRSPARYEEWLHGMLERELLTP